MSTLQTPTDNVKITIIDKDQQYVLERRGLKYFADGIEIHQHDFRQNDEEDEEEEKKEDDKSFAKQIDEKYNQDQAHTDFYEFIDNGYDEDEALLLTNFRQDGPFQGDDVVLSITTFCDTILLMLYHNDLKIDNIINFDEQFQPQADGGVEEIITLKSNNKTIKCEGQYDFRQKILELLSIKP